MELESVLTLIGQYGTYQKQRCFLLCLVAIPLAFQNYLHAFLLYTPEHRCSSASVWNGTEHIRNLSPLRFVNETIPVELKEDIHSEPEEPEISFDPSCSFYKISKNKQEIKSSRKRTIPIVVDCNKWEYNNSHSVATAVTEFNLVCGRQNYGQFILMSYLIGAGIGAFVTGYITDRYGRQKGLCMCIFIHLISSFSLAWVPNVVFFILFHLLCGFASTGAFLTAYVTGIELVGYKKRIYPALTFFLCYSVGVLLLATLGQFLTDWRMLTISTSVPTALLLLYWWLIPESPRWLLAGGLQDRAHRIMGIMTDTNKKDWKYIKSRYDNDTNSTRIETRLTKLLQQEKLKTSVVLFNWFFLTSNPYQGFDVSAYNGGERSHPSRRLGGLSFLDTVALITCLVLLRFRIGERKPLFFLGILGYAATTFCRCFFSKNDKYSSFYLEREWSDILWNVIGRLSTTMAIGVLSLMTAELFPTNIRGFQLGLALMSASIGKFIWYLAIITHASEFTLRIISGLLAGCSVIFGNLLIHVTPETHDTCLPDIRGDIPRNEFQVPEVDVRIKADDGRVDKSASYIKQV